MAIIDLFFGRKVFLRASELTGKHKHRGNVCLRLTFSWMLFRLVAAATKSPGGGKACLAQDGLEAIVAVCESAGTGSVEA